MLYGLIALLYFRFVYKFLAQVPGTHFYHSHTSFQRGDGAFGAYVVRQPKELEHHGDQYDEDLTEHYIMLQEYFHIVSPSLRLCQNKVRKF